MPPGDNSSATPSRSIPAWFSAIHIKQAMPNPTDKNLREQVGYKPPPLRHQLGPHPTAATVKSRLQVILAMAPNAYTRAQAVGLMGSISSQWAEAASLRESLTRYLSPGIPDPMDVGLAMDSGARLCPLAPPMRTALRDLLNTALDDVQGLIMSIPLLGSLGRKMAGLVVSTSELYVQYRDRAMGCNRRVFKRVLTQGRLLVRWKGRAAPMLQGYSCMLDWYVERGSAWLCQSARAVRHQALRRVTEASSAEMERQYQLKRGMYKAAVCTYDRKT